jgi:hypothetical protein
VTGGREVGLRAFAEDGDVRDIEGNLYQWCMVFTIARRSGSCGVGGFGVEWRIERIKGWAALKGREGKRKGGLRHQ